MRIFTTNDISAHIDSLIMFIGAERIRKCVATWQNSIQNSPALVRHHKMQESFYWWPGFASYWESKATGSPYSMETLMLAKDATKVLDALEGMPASVKGKYGGALGDVRNAPMHLFEISMAHHFMSFGYSVRWLEDAGRGIAEFIVVTPDIEFDVECKYITVNAGRLITREEFSRFGSLVEAELRKRRVMGSVRVTLIDRLPKPLPDLGKIAATIGAAFDAGTISGPIEFAPWGAADVELAAANDVPIDWDEAQMKMRDAMPSYGHAFARAESLNGKPVNLITLTSKSVKQDEYLKAIYCTIKDAAYRQFSKSRPGLLCVHIPEISNFENMLDESSLRNMTAYFFSKSDHRHVCAISYSSDTRIILEETGYQFTIDALAYKNAFCRFPGAKDIQLFSHESPVPELQTSEFEQMKNFDTNE